MECHRLRVKDVDLEQRQLVIRDGKGFKDRITVLPETVLPDLTTHLERTRALRQVFSKRGMLESGAYVHCTGKGRKTVLL